MFAAGWVFVWFCRFLGFWMISVCAWSLFWVWCWCVLCLFVMLIVALGWFICVVSTCVLGFCLCNFCFALVVCLFISCGFSSFGLLCFLWVWLLMTFDFDYAFASSFVVWVSGWFVLLVLVCCLLFCLLFGWFVFIILDDLVDNSSFLNYYLN